VLEKGCGLAISGTVLKMNIYTTVRSAKNPAAVTGIKIAFTAGASGQQKICSHGFWPR